MHCPFCNTEETKVIDSRLVTGGTQVWRRRACVQCKARFTTYEQLHTSMPSVVKNDGRRSPFAVEKLRTGIQKALEKRPVSIEQIDALVHRLVRKLHNSGEREIASAVIGEWVMEALRELDPVAYVRFASVYRSFQDMNAFREAIQRLERPEPDTGDD